jgi:hypothetical protein
MRERYRDISPIDPEERIDGALASGAFADAQEYLKELRKTNPRPDKYHHVILKQKALPLYEMAYGANTSKEHEAIHKDADAVYGLVGYLLQHELYTFSHAFHEEIGRISELAFFALHLRQPFSEETGAVILPAPMMDDRKGIDFYLSPVGTKSITDGHAYQVKTRAEPEVREQYRHSKITLISMDDIDKHAGNPHHPKSLPRTILRELGIPLIGTDEVNPERFSEGADTNRLDRAGALIEKIANRSITSTTARALTRTSLQALRMDDAA